MAEQSDKQGAIGAYLSTLVRIGKDGVALLRDAALLLLAVLLVGWPETFNDILVRAGFEEGSLVGLQWKARVSKQDSELVAAQSLIADLKTQNANLEKALADAKAQLSDDALISRIGDLEKLSAQMQPATSRIQDSLQTTIVANADLVQKLEPATAAAAIWAVVFSGDSSLEAARFETGTVAPRLGINTAQIYYRQGSYRSLVTAADRAQASQLLNTLKTKRADAYIVNLDSWCPAAIARDGYLDCSSPG